MKMYDFIIAGAGIFGLTTAIELSKAGYQVCILNPRAFPDPLAASTDISKAVRIDYGKDLEYMQMCIESIEIWKEWNEFFSTTLYHEVGYLVLSKSPLGARPESYVDTSYQLLMQEGYTVDLIDQEVISKRFPAINPDVYVAGFLNPVGGFAEAGYTLEVLAQYAQSLGVDLFPNQEVVELVITHQSIEGVKTTSGGHFKAGQVILCTGNSTPYLLPELHPYIQITGHPVFHLKPVDPAPFTPPNLAVFAADIANTGWYGFPFHPKEKVVKIANHGVGLPIHPNQDERVVYDSDIRHFRSFLADTFPSLVEAPIVYTRRCCYTDTLDGHFWIDHHPTIKGLTVGSGGSGHGLKMGPVVGKMIAAKALRQSHKWSERYLWRHLEQSTNQEEEARYKA